MPEFESTRKFDNHLQSVAISLAINGNFTLNRATLSYFIEIVVFRCGAVFWPHPVGDKFHK